MINDFNTKHICLIKDLGYNIESKNDLSDANTGDLIEDVEIYFQLHGIGANDEVNDAGILCEEILDVLAEI